MGLFIRNSRIVCALGLEVDPCRTGNEVISNTLSLFPMHLGVSWIAINWLMDHRKRFCPRVTGLELSQ